MKLCVIVGNRPQFIKAAALFRAADSSIDIKLIHSGQHFDHNLSHVFFEEMRLPKPDYFLGIGGTSHGKMTGMMLEKIEEILLQNQPDWTLVFGDTNTTLAGALAASKLNLPTVHVEAGLRSFNRAMPEEINRILTDHCSDLLFVPNRQSFAQLEKEGVPSDRIKIVGDVMYDSFLHFQKEALSQSQILNALDLTPKNYILATVHRQENTDQKNRLEEIIDGLIAVSQSIPVILPLHPRTRKKMRDFNFIDKASEHISIIEPIGYFDMIMLMLNAQTIFTDSGGVQKESYYANIPCFILREETEWVELVEQGHHQLVGSNTKKIHEAFQQRYSLRKPHATNLYGDGKAAYKIITALS